MGIMIQSCRPESRAQHRSGVDIQHLFGHIQQLASLSSHYSSWFANRSATNSYGPSDSTEPRAPSFDCFAAGTILDDAQRKGRQSARESASHPAKIPARGYSSRRRQMASAMRSASGICPINVSINPSAVSDANQLIVESPRFQFDKLPHRPPTFHLGNT